MNGGGAADPTWRIAHGAMALAGDDQYLYVAGDVRSPGLRRHLLSGDGSVDLDWAVSFRADPIFDGKLNSLVKAGPWLYAAGRFDKVNGLPIKNVVRIDAVGAPDQDLLLTIPATSDGTLGRPDDKEPQWIGRIGESPLLGGAFERVNGAPAQPPLVLNVLSPPKLSRFGARVFATAADGNLLGIEFFRITGIQGGTLATSDGQPLLLGIHRLQILDGRHVAAGRPGEALHLVQRIGDGD